MDTCPKCGQELKEPISQTFAYDQLFELMKIEENRRIYLDSKANTYIGLLSIAITILTAFGGFIAIRGSQINEITDLQSQQVFVSPLLLGLIYVLYIFVVSIFLLSVILAFRAYAVGTGKVSIASGKSGPETRLDKLGKKIINKLDLLLIPSTDKYTGMPIECFAENKESPLFEFRNELITTLNDLVRCNRDLNIEKANRILNAYRTTTLGISILLILILIIAIGVGVG